MNVDKTICYLATLFFFASELIAQDDHRITTGLLRYFKNYPQEKVYVHTDKDGYITGQSVWFSIYCTVNGAPSDLSNIVYVQLVNPEEKIVLQRKIQMERDG